MGQVKNLRGETPSSELAKLELKPYGIGETRKLSIAVQGKKIKDATLEEITQILRFVMMKLGIRGNNLPSNEERMVLLEHISRGYGSHALDEIRLAFDMAMVGKLDGDFLCYENFSCDYFSRVMKAYRKWSAEEYKQIRTEPPMVTNSKENLSHFAMLRWLSEQIRFIKTGMPFEYIPLPLYDYFDKRGKIPATTEEKVLYLEKAVSWREGELTKEIEKRNEADNRNALQEFRRMKERGYFTGPEVERLKALAKKLLFFALVQKNAR